MPSDQPPAAAGGRWLTPLAWAVLAAAVAAVIGMTWVLGGFAPATTGGRPTAAGERIELRRWDVVVERAEYTDQAVAGYDVEPRIRLVLRVTNLDRATQVSPEPSMITVRVSGQELTDDILVTGGSRSYNYDPDVPAALAYEFRWPAEGSTEPPRPPEEITVIVRDERPLQNFIYDEILGAGEPVAAVRLPCPDVRRQR